MKRAAHAIYRALFFCGVLATSTQAAAAPITFNTALPVAKNALINREQLIIRRFDQDSTSANRDLSVNGLISVLAYGVTAKLALFATIPYLDKTLALTADGRAVTRSSEGMGDLKLFGRYTFYQQDQRSKTLRIAGFGGVKAPTGDNNKTDKLGRLPMPLQSGTGAWGYLAGVVITYQTLDFQIDGQLSAEHNGRANDFEMGGQYRADMSVQYRLQPQELSADSHRFLYGVLEANLINQDNNRLSGINDPDSGGTTLYLTPGIQFVTPGYILEAAVQLPVLQHLGRAALETDYVFTAGFRINF